MKKYYVGDDMNDTEVKPVVQKGGLPTIEGLQQELHNMSIMGDIEPRHSDVIVRVRDNVGTGQYLATAPDNHAWLTSQSYRKERRGDTTLYYIKVSK